MYAKGKHALAICDRCGMKCPYRMLVPDGDNPGLRVHRSCRDEPHPAEKPVKTAEGIALKNPRPDRDDDSPGAAVDHSGTARGGSANSLTLAADASSVQNDYINGTLTLTGGAGSEQSRTIRGYNVSSKVATVAPWGRNALTKSSAVDHANWTKQNGITITADYGSAPDGTMKADRVQTDGASLARYFQTVTGFEGETVCFAIKMRSLTGENQSVQIHLRETGFGTTYVTGIKTVTPDWQTFSVSAAIPGGSAGVMVLFYDSGGTNEWDVLVCEHQFNEGATPDEFIETDDAAIAYPDDTTNYSVTVPDTLDDAMGFTNHFGGGT